jgi:DtxR family transcriptional regulator, Mn-dependent transcriptional regulator
MPSEQLEDYLKNIYKIESSEGKVATTALSRQLGIAPASVTEMVKKLAEEGIVTYTPYHGVQLTNEGRRRALQVIRRHRLWEAFLVEVLKFDWHEIDEEADRLEHFTSEKLERHIDELLGFPRTDPHGDAIPSPEGRLSDLPSESLDGVEEGKTVIVHRVNDSSPEILRLASKLGIALNRKIKVKERVGFDGTLRVVVGRKERFINSRLAQNIYVEAD